ncbi:hypothetical protein BB559_005100 [Furculomyces boomerangus]|uniref:HMG box domain-containing protein n=1 Tax=Furculomyces boomerangus TaxID=61424 RepID=A0A2T9YAS6_9FUNG|nr:hypothetical protein BB559_005100 [Furculomyces boomerangus]
MDHFSKDYPHQLIPGQLIQTYKSHPQGFNFVIDPNATRYIRNNQVGYSSETMEEMFKSQNLINTPVHSYKALNGNLVDMYPKIKNSNSPNSYTSYPSSDSIAENHQMSVHQIQTKSLSDINFSYAQFDESHNTLNMGLMEFENNLYKKSKQQKQKRTPRPPNAFILYRKDKQESVIKSHSGVSNKEISVIIGKMWKSEPTDVKDKYKEMAEEEKRKHKKLYPDYKYQPRKSKKLCRIEHGLRFSHDNSIFNQPLQTKMFHPGTDLAGYGPFIGNFVEHQLPGHIAEHQNNQHLIQLADSYEDKNCYNYVNRNNITQFQDYPEAYINNSITSLINQDKNNIQNELSLQQNPEMQLNVHPEMVLQNENLVYNSANSRDLNPMSDPNQNDQTSITQQFWGQNPAEEFLEFGQLPDNFESPYFSSIIPSQIASVHQMQQAQNIYPENNIANFQYSINDSNKEIGFNSEQTTHPKLSFSASAFNDAISSGSLENSQNMVGDNRLFEINGNEVASDFVNKNILENGFDNTNIKD